MTAETSKYNLTSASYNLFTALVKDAGNWSGMPLYQGLRSENGNLTDLKRKGLVGTQEDEGNTWVYFTEAGRDMALQVVAPTRRLYLQVENQEGGLTLFERDGCGNG